MKGAAFVKRSALLLAAVSVVAACGGGGSSASSSPKPSGAGSTSASAAPAAVAEAGAIRPSDLGTPWSQYQAASGAQPVTKKGCAGQVGFDVSTLKAVYAGAVVRRGSVSPYAAPFAFVFDSAASAERFVTVAGSQPYRECRAKALSATVKANKKSPPGARYRIDAMRTIDADGVQRIQMGYQFQALVNGKIRDANGRTEDLLYRRGAVVSDVLLESARQAGDAANAVDQVLGEIDKAARTALSRCCPTE